MCVVYYMYDWHKEFFDLIHKMSEREEIELFGEAPPSVQITPVDNDDDDNDNNDDSDASTQPPYIGTPSVSQYYYHHQQEEPPQQQQPAVVTVVEAHHPVQVAVDDEGAAMMTSEERQQQEEGYISDSADAPIVVARLMEGVVCVDTVTGVDAPLVTISQGVRIIDHRVVPNIIYVPYSAADMTEFSFLCSNVHDRVNDPHCAMERVLMNVDVLNVPLAHHNEFLSVRAHAEHTKFFERLVRPSTDHMFEPNHGYTYYQNCTAYDGSAPDPMHAVLDAHNVPVLYASRVHATGYIQRQLRGIPTITNWPSNEQYRRIEGIIPTYQREYMPLFYRGEEIFQPKWATFYTLLSMDISDAFCAVNCQTVSVVEDVYRLPPHRGNVKAARWYTNEYVVKLLERMLYVSVYERNLDTGVPTLVTYDLYQDTYPSRLGSLKNLGGLWTYVSGGRGNTKNKSRMVLFNKLCVFLVHMGVQPIAKGEGLEDHADHDGWVNSVLDAVRRSAAYYSMYNEIRRLLCIHLAARGLGFRSSEYAAVHKPKPDTNTGGAPGTTSMGEVGVLLTQRSSNPIDRYMKRQLAHFRMANPGRKYELHYSEDTGNVIGILDVTTDSPRLVYARDKAEEDMTRKREREEDGDDDNGETFGAVGEFGGHNNPPMHMQLYRRTVRGQQMRSPHEAYLDRARDILIRPPEVMPRDRLEEIIVTGINKLVRNVFDPMILRGLDLPVSVDFIRGNVLPQVTKNVYRICQAVINEEGLVFKTSDKVADGQLDATTALDTMYDQLMVYRHLVGTEFIKVFGSGYYERPAVGMEYPPRLAPAVDTFGYQALLKQHNPLIDYAVCDFLALTCYDVLFARLFEVIDYCALVCRKSVAHLNAVFSRRLVSFDDIVDVMHAYVNNNSEVELACRRIRHIYELTRDINIGDGDETETQQRSPPKYFSFDEFYDGVVYPAFLHGIRDLLDRVIVEAGYTSHDGQEKDNNRAYVYGTKRMSRNVKMLFGFGVPDYAAVDEIDGSIYTLQFLVSYLNSIENGRLVPMVFNENGTLVGFEIDVLRAVVEGPPPSSPPMTSDDEEE